MKKMLSVLILLGMLITVGCAQNDREVSDTDVIKEVNPRGNNAEDIITEVNPRENNAEDIITEVNPQDNKTEDIILNSDSDVVSWVNGAIKENLTENMELSPKDDFHLFVNYDWLRSTEIPAGYSSWSCFGAVAEETNEKIRSVLSDEALEGHDAELVRSFYHAILDWDERNKRGIEPLVQIIEDIKDIQSLDELTSLISDWERSRFVPWFIEAAVTPGRADSSRNIVEIKTRQHNNGFSSSYSSLRNPAEEKKLVASILSRAGYSQIEAAQMYDVAMNDVEPYLSIFPSLYEDNASEDFYAKHSSVLTKEEVGNLTSAFPLLNVLKARGFGENEEYQVLCPELFKNLDLIYTEGMLEKLKKYLIVCSVMNIASYMDREAYEMCQTYKNKVFGIKGSVSDEEEALSTVENKLDVPLSRAYLQKYDASEIKTDITKLIEQIVAEYKDMLRGEDWLSEETRKQAIDKLEVIKIHAIYPEEWTDYSQLNLAGLSFWDAVVKIKDYNKEKEISRIGKNVDGYEWKMSTLQANAYYDVQDNSINIFLGIMGGDLYYDGISDEELYAGIGTLIGHELSHAFDTSGALYDKNGNYKNWWTEQDYEAFRKRVEKLVSYYDRIPAGNAWYEGNIKGAQICKEAIADMAGMKVILRLAEKKENFDYERFFIAYAKHWREVSTNEAEKNKQMADTHPLNYLRTNVTLQQFDIFFKTFSIQKGDNMYLDEEHRVCVW